MKIGDIPLSQLVLTHPSFDIPGLPLQRPAPPASGNTVDPSRAAARAKHRFIRTFMPQPTAGASNTMEMNVAPKSDTQLGKKQEKPLGAVVIRTTLAGMDARIADLEKDENLWSSMTARLMKKSTGDDALSNNFRKFTTAIGATLVKLRDTNGPDGQKAYLGIWPDARDQATFLALAAQLDELFTRNIGRHVRDLADDEANRTKPVVVRALADATGYQSSEPFTRGDIKWVGNLYQELAGLFPIYRDLMSRARLPEIPDTDDTRAASHVPRDTVPDTPAAHTGQENAGCWNFSSVSRLGARLRSPLLNRAQDS